MNLISNSPDETADIGFKLGKLLHPGDVVCLYGELGSGKTTFVRGIARSVNISSRDITSASFTIIAEYESDPPFFHIDLYRIHNDDDLYQTGIWDCIGNKSISVIEWAERISEGLPGDAIKVKIDFYGNERRIITITGIHEEHWNNM